MYITKGKKVKMPLAQLCLAVCHPVDCSWPGSSVHGIVQAGMLECIAIPSPGDLPDPGIEPRPPTVEANSLPSQPPGKPTK